MLNFIFCDIFTVQGVIIVTEKNLDAIIYFFNERL